MLVSGFLKWSFMQEYLMWTWCVEYLTSCTALFRISLSCSSRFLFSSSSVELPYLVFISSIRFRYVA